MLCNYEFWTHRKGNIGFFLSKYCACWSEQMSIADAFNVSDAEANPVVLKCNTLMAKWWLDSFSCTRVIMCSVSIRE